jgi:hypothetical protein
VAGPRRARIASEHASPGVALASTGHHAGTIAAEALASAPDDVSAAATAASRTVPPFGTRCNAEVRFACLAVLVVPGFECLSGRQHLDGQWGGGVARL